jgi:hypothetical protein
MDVTDVSIRSDFRELLTNPERFLPPLGLHQDDQPRFDHKRMILQG